MMIASAKMLARKGVFAPCFNGRGRVERGGALAESLRSKISAYIIAHFRGKVKTGCKFCGVGSVRKRTRGSTKALPYENTYVSFFGRGWRPDSPSKIERPVRDVEGAVLYEILASRLSVGATIGRPLVRILSLPLIFSHTARAKRQSGGGTSWRNSKNPRTRRARRSRWPNGRHKVAPLRAECASRSGRPASSSRSAP